jgi:hypothetical protein
VQKTPPFRSFFAMRNGGGVFSTHVVIREVSEGDGANQWGVKGISMKTIRILFYKPDKKSGWISRGIGWWSKLWNKPLVWLPDYSHVELEFCDRPQNLTAEHAKTAKENKTDNSANSAVSAVKSGICFSSATYRKGRQEITGVRMAPASQILKNPEHWDYIEIQIHEVVEQKLFDEAWSHCGQGYDYLAILGFCLPWHFQDDHRWYCSEIVNHVMWMAGLIDEPRRWSPLASAGMYLAAGYSPLRDLATEEEIKKYHGIQITKH